MRFVRNPFHEKAAKGAEKVTEPWLKEKMEGLVARIVEEARDDEALTDAGPYVGASGMAYALIKAAVHLRNGNELLREADKVLRRTLKLNAARAALKEARFLSGHLGLYTICILRERNADLEARVLAAGEAAAQIDFPSDEIFVGRAGFLAAALLLNEEVASIVPADTIRRVLSAIVASGRRYAALSRSRFPLMFAYHGSEYLGAAHGLACILHFLISFSELLEENELLLVRTAAEMLVSLQDERGNFPSSLREGSPKRKSEEDELIHWCHGAPGVAYLLALLYLKFHEPRHLQALLRAGELVWERGVLKKGPGICHGVAGSGFVFLLIYRVTQDQTWLLRAKTFARLMFDPEIRSQQRTPDSPWSLFEGWAGSVCFLAALLDPQRAQFPLYHIPNSLFPH